MKRAAPVLFLFLFLSLLPAFAQEEAIEKEPESPFSNISSLYLEVEGLPPDANFGYPDIEKRARRRLKEGLPALEMVDDEFTASGIMNLSFPGKGEGEVALEVLGYQVNPDTGEADLVSLWRQEVAYDKNMRKFFFFSEVLDGFLEKFVDDYRAHTEKKRKSILRRDRPEITRDRLELLGPPR